jgi:hypothetical protein
MIILTPPGVEHPNSAISVTHGSRIPTGTAPDCEDLLEVLGWILGFTICQFESSSIRLYDANLGICGSEYYVGI